MHLLWFSPHCHFVGFKIARGTGSRKLVKNCLNQWCLPPPHNAFALSSAQQSHQHGIQFYHPCDPHQQWRHRPREGVTISTGTSTPCHQTIIIGYLLNFLQPSNPLSPPTKRNRSAKPPAIELASEDVPSASIFFVLKNSGGPASDSFGRSEALVVS